MAQSPFKAPVGTSSITKLYEPSGSTTPKAETPFTVTEDCFIYFMFQINDDTSPYVYINGTEVANFGDWWTGGISNEIIIPFTLFATKGDIVSWTGNARMRMLYIVY